MGKIVNILASLLVVAATTGCTSAYQASGGYAGDDLYAIHDRTQIAREQQARAEAEKAAAEARRAEWEARLAEAQAAAAEDRYYSYNENGYESVLADTYESAYARRLRGFESPTYRMPSSYYNFRYGSAFTYVSAYDPAFYNVIVMGDQVWVEPKYITSMFGTWGTVVYADPWYYGWNSAWAPTFSFGSWGWSLGWNSWYSPWLRPWDPWYPWYNSWYGYGWGWGHGWNHGWGPGHHHPHYGPIYWNGGAGHRPSPPLAQRPRPEAPSSGRAYGQPARQGSSTFDRPQRGGYDLGVRGGQSSSVRDNISRPSGGTNTRYNGRGTSGSYNPGGNRGSTTFNRGNSSATRDSYSPSQNRGSSSGSYSGGGSSGGGRSVGGRNAGGR